MAKTSQSKFSTDTPIRLQDAVFNAFVEEYRGVIADPDLGASYAVNYALAAHLRRLGHAVPDVKTRSELIVAGQRRRWDKGKPSRKPLTEDQRLRKQERDRARRAKMKAERETTNTKLEKGESS